MVLDELETGEEFNLLMPKSKVTANSGVSELKKSRVEHVCLSLDLDRKDFCQAELLNGTENQDCLIFEFSFYTVSVL